jgi:hypothetical protein
VFRVSSYSKIPLSGSTDGRGIKVVATSIGSGTTIHTATSSATLFDMPRIYAYNSDTVQRILTLGWGGTTDPDDLIKTTVQPGDGLTLITADLILRNSLVLVAAGDSANKLVVFGFVNRAS